MNIVGFRYFLKHLFSFHSLWNGADHNFLMSLISFDKENILRKIEKYTTQSHSIVVIIVVDIIYIFKILGFRHF